MEQGMLQATGYPAERVYFFVEGRGFHVEGEGTISLLHISGLENEKNTINPGSLQLR